jgi:hypothetical protein
MAEAPRSDADLVEAWIRLGQQPDHAKSSSDDQAQNELTELLDTNPERLFRLMGAVIQRAPTDKALSLIGAGHLEDLLCSPHGPKIIDRVLDNARTDPNWRFALGCVWPGRAENADVKQRITAAIWKYFPNGTP